MEETKDCYVDIDVLFRRRRKRRKIFRKGEYLFFWRRIKTEKEKEENIWRRSLQKFATILRSLGFGLGLETFANFWKVSVLVSESLVSEKSFGFGRFGIGKKVPVSVSVKILVSSFSDVGYKDVYTKGKIWGKFEKKTLNKLCPRPCFVHQVPLKFEFGFHNRIKFSLILKQGVALK